MVEKDYLQSHLYEVLFKYMVHLQTNIDLFIDWQEGERNVPVLLLSLSPVLGPSLN